MPITSKTKQSKKLSPPKSNKPRVRAIAPVALSYQPPRSSFRSIVPQKGCAAYSGCDFIGSLSSTGVLQATSYGTMNPTNGTYFPRLSLIAGNFRRYHYRKLRYHFFGRSASTQKGVLGFASMVDDFTTADADVDSEAEVKNMQNCIVLRGWESGVHEVEVQAQGPAWYTTDTQEATGFNNVSPGFTYFTIPATTAAGDLAWDVYVEYEIEFDVSILNTTNALKTKRPIQPTEKSEHELTLSRLQKRLNELEAVHPRSS